MQVKKQKLIRHLIDKPTKEQVRVWVSRRWQKKAPPLTAAEIQEALGWRLNRNHDEVRRNRPDI